MIETAAVIELLGKLKDLKRSGWVMKKVSAPESVADHSWGVALLAVLLTPEGLDGHKCLQLAIVHDLQESIVGDITPADGIGREEKSRRERAAVGLLAEKLNFPELKALFEEFEALETPEARFVKDMDRIEAVLQARYYDMTQRSPEKLVPEFSAYAEKNLCSGEKAIAEILKKLDG